MRLKAHQTLKKKVREMMYKEHYHVGKDEVQILREKKHAGRAFSGFQEIS
jgi:hypothetical protein